MSNEIRHVLAIIDTATEIGCAVDGLVQGGFVESDVVLTRGTEEAGPRGVAARGAERCRRRRSPWPA